MTATLPPYDPECIKRSHRPHGRIAVAYYGVGRAQCAERGRSWTVIDGPAAAQAVADKLDAQPILRARDMTSISQGLVFAAQLFETSGVKGIRRVIDVSGDVAQQRRSAS